MKGVDDDKLILYMVIAGLLFMLWNAYGDERHKDICEGLSERECQEYIEAIDAIGTPP